MKIRLISDVHEEFALEKQFEETAIYNLPEHEDDSETVLIIAGDWNKFTNNRKYTFGAMRLIEMAKRFKYVIFIMGNHDYWGGVIGEAQEWIKHFLRQNGPDNLFFLDAESVVLDGVKFIGATMWTDMDSDPFMSWKLNNERWSDLVRIRHPGSYRRLRTFDITAINLRHREFIESELKNAPEDQQVVVVTHHAPCLLSSSEYFKNDPTTHACYVCDMTKVMETYDNLVLWCHGHMHNSSDYEVFGTRIVCNPLGYVIERNRGFDPNLQIAL